MVLSIIWHLRMVRLHDIRREESICTFARALPARDHDTWIVRAVYEELSDHFRVPLRPTDDVTKLFGLIDDDAEDIAVRVAYRARRSLENSERNPLHNRVVTVADWIAFFENQPNYPSRADAR